MPRKQNSQIAWGNAKESKQEIINAAAKCFEQYGPQRTSMDDIAEAAGFPAKTLYRIFDDRPKLIQAILESRWATIAKKIRRRIAKATCFEEALLEGSRHCRLRRTKRQADHDIIHKATDHNLEQFLLRGNERIYKANQDIWLTAIEKARTRGSYQAAPLRRPDHRDYCEHTRIAVDA